ncbi:Formyl transferase [Muriicola jejuensis]|uniref:phosphoribosylglycinamide formyltransferase 1 n=1 Tax=Muriicola jejuensis TaxID=504488 RepID=A0A6P0UE58_9FLAO|nr:formyl transferase [Muriicola jejuensis]NER10018.1 formyl transferase [Muriicola jejuensis]SMP03728.1 Formyl transferase [Muriicola jejuensis]
MEKRIIMLVGDWYYPKMVYHSLASEFNIEHIIVDRGESTRKLLRRRIKRLGLLHVIGQVLFRILVVSQLNRRSKGRFQEILDANGIRERDYEPEKTTKVNTINSEEGRNLLKRLNPDIVVIVTTRILSKKTLNTINARFINIHSGITPLYRGLHGAYWALINDDRENCGVTVHLVDEGIDTGNILYQDNITNEITPRDNFMTYTYLQLAKAIPLLKRSIRDIQSNSLKTKANTKKEINNRLYYHPTLWFYLYKRWIKGVK